MGEQVHGTPAPSLFNLARLKKFTQEEQGRLFLWVPVSIGLGVGLYFGAPVEPPFWRAVIFVLALSTFVVIRFFYLRRSALWDKAAVFALLAGVGFIAADFRAGSVYAPILQREIRPTTITGVLSAVEENAQQRRLTISVDTIAGLSRQDTPARVRVNWRGKGFDASPGDLIEIRAGLSPPPAPVAPGAFDFARHLYFLKIGAVGFAVAPPKVLSKEPATVRAIVAGKIEGVRLSLSRRILSSAPGDGGALVAAMVTGKRAAISERADDALRDTGLAHLIAISGLHMGLATGLIFFSVRAALAMAPFLALKFPIKKWAAIAALLSGFAYLLLAGGSWSARRAFIMTAIVFIAIIADRRAFSLRNVAIAACLILLTTPEALLNPGFQMSFAAVTALIAAYEWSETHWRRIYDPSWFSRLKTYGLGVAATDTIAASATAPFALYHFNRAAVYSLPANLIAMPLMAFWIMPLAITALLLIPFGLDGGAWRLAAFGAELVLSCAVWLAARPGAVVVTAQWPLLALLFLTLGGLWLCVQKAAWRYIGIFSVPIAFLLVSATPPPDIFVGRKGDNAAVVIQGADDQAILTLFDRRKSRFEAKAWRDYAGILAAPVSLKKVSDCDWRGCVVSVLPNRGRQAPIFYAISDHPMGLAEDCARAAIVIALYPVPQKMRNSCAAVIIDRRMVWEKGAHAIWVSPKGAVTIRSVEEARGARSWTQLGNSTD